MAGDIFGCHKWCWRVTGIRWVEVRMLINNPQSPQDSPAPQELSGLSVGIAKVENPGLGILAVIKEIKNTGLFSAV